jgi:hypothetical protein
MKRAHGVATAVGAQALQQDFSARRSAATTWLITTIRSAHFIASCAEEGAALMPVAVRGK